SLLFEVVYSNPPTDSIFSELLYLEVNGVRKRCSNGSGHVNIIGCSVQLGVSLPANIPVVFSIYAHRLMEVGAEKSFRLIISEAGDGQDGITIAGMHPNKQLIFPETDVPLQLIYV
ncbi:hypothetical protein MYX76_18890, partial [Desulfobacterota bacterium AH_259_B03_O07]|nr:hypothetical protein [Desulfobacterota bacterium AH_259_B03_O07]